ncbi:MAG: hypothetical protein WCG19_06365 [Chlorobiaceae bacterium]
MPAPENQHPYFFRSLYAVILFLFITLPVATPADAAKNKRSATSADAKKNKLTANPIDAADEALWHMNYQKADSLYSSELRNNPNNVDLQWKMARLRVSQGEAVPPENSDGRLQQFRKAAEYSRNCIALDSTNANGHTWLAVSLGMMADKIGTKEMLKRANEIKRELDTALRLNPNDATAWTILGSYYREASKIGWFKRTIGNTLIGGVPKGDRVQAEKAFRKAISLDPRIIRNYHELALICIDSGNKEEAIALIKSALDRPVLVESDKKRIEDMRALLITLSKKQPMPYEIHRQR